MTIDHAAGAAADSGAAEASCPRCRKPGVVCVCDAFTPIANRIEVVVLQHPQEKDVVLGTGLLTALHLTNARFRVGLSWPSLAAAVGHPVEPRQWAVLFPGPAANAAPPGEVAMVDARGSRKGDQAATLAQLRGIVLLDGSWSQAKALWWRNPWVLRAHRLVLGARHPSLYGRLRREPRRDSLSTLEAAAFALSRLEGRPEIETAMLSTFRRMLQRYRDSRPPEPPAPQRGRRAAGKAGGPSSGHRQTGEGEA